MVSLTFLPFGSPLGAYERQAELLMAGHAMRDTQALEIIHHHLPRFLDERIPWLPRSLRPEDIASAGFTLEDARLTVARGYSFLDWAALAEHVEGCLTVGSPTEQFERAVEAVVTGDARGLKALLVDAPSLARARSQRRTCHDPPVHRATLLHYLGANGVENYNQRSPRNAVEMATLLLNAGAEVDALADMYGGQYATMSMLASSSPPREAGVQLPLIELLLDHGASLSGVGSKEWGSNIRTALAFGYRDVAELFVRRGALVDQVDLAAGLGRADILTVLLPTSTAEGRHRALALAGQLGCADCVRLLLESGETPDRYNPPGLHAHATPLHHAALEGHLETVRALVEHGARLDVEDTTYRATPLGWAEHNGQAETASYLRSKGAR